MFIRMCRPLNSVPSQRSDPCLDIVEAFKYDLHKAGFAGANLIAGPHFSLDFRNAFAIFRMDDGDPEFIIRQLNRTFLKSQLPGTYSII